MLYIGELEFNDRHFHCDGAGPSYLFGSYDEKTQISRYSMSPSPIHWHVGDLTMFRYHVPVRDFLQCFVDSDEQIGRGVVMRRNECKVRLKDFGGDWIERKKIKLPFHVECVSRLYPVSAIGQNLADGRIEDWNDKVSVKMQFPEPGKHIRILTSNEKEAIHYRTYEEFWIHLGNGYFKQVYKKVNDGKF